MNWMAWTLPTAAFFIAVAIAVTSMTLLELRWPTVRRKGWLPMATTRGDRFFLSLLSAAVVHVVWLAVTDSHPAGATVLAAIGAVTLLRWG